MRNLRTRSRVQAKKIRVLSRSSKTPDSRMLKPVPTLDAVFLYAPHAFANLAFSTTSTGRESSSLEPCSVSSGSSFIGPSRVDGSAKSEIACAGGIWRVKEDDGGIGSGKVDSGGTGAGLATSDSALL